MSYVITFQGEKYYSGQTLRMYNNILYEGSLVEFLENNPEQLGDNCVTVKKINDQYVMALVSDLGDFLDDESNDILLKVSWLKTLQPPEGTCPDDYSVFPVDEDSFMNIYVYKGKNMFDVNNISDLFGGYNLANDLLDDEAFITGLHYATFGDTLMITEAGLITLCKKRFPWSLQVLCYCLEQVRYNETAYV